MQLTRILLVEDERHDVELVRTALADHAREMTSVADGVVALDYLYRRAGFGLRPPGHPAVVLLDLKLPRLDGFDVLRQMKADPVLRMIPVVMLTSSREERDLVQAYEMGANGYVVKTIGFEEYAHALLAVVRFWLEVNEPPPGCVRRAE